MVTEKDFRLWHNINLEAVAENGNWLSYTKKYDRQPDTLFLKGIKSFDHYSFPGGISGHFGNSFFSCILPDSSLSILNLRSRKIVSLRQCATYDITMQNSRIIALLGSAELKTLVITDNGGRVLDSIKNVESYISLPMESYIAFVQKKGSLSSLEYYDLLTGRKELLYETEDNIQEITFGENSRHIAFFSGSSSEPNTINLIDCSTGIKKSYSVDEENLRILLNQKLKISRDGSKVFFDTYFMPPVAKTDQKVEIWHSMDKVIYPIRSIESSAKKFFFSVWYPHKGTFRRHGLEREKAQLSGRQNYAIFYRQGLSGQDGSRYHVNSINIESLETGTRLLAVKDIIMEKSRVSLSPTEDKMAYYYNDAWWCYDMKSEKHISLTGTIRGKWDDKEEARTQPDVYAAALWTKDGKSLLLQDKNDLWLVSTDGLSSRRITNGKERDIEFRIDWYSLTRNKDQNPYQSLQNPAVSLSEPICLNASGSSNEEGYFVLQKGKMPQKLFYGSFASAQLFKTAKGRYFSKIQSFSLPPVLCWTDGPRKQIHTAFKSNQHHSSYSWGSSKLITYRTPDGKSLNAALLYPAGYDSSKKYPMIVKIYQSLSYHIYEYMIPSLSDNIGFNPVNYTLDGYLVLLPDIGYVYGKTGISAAECVESAVNKIKEMGIADNSRIGLIGHSFGGYQVNFIMTRSSSFAAAVSGAGVSDMTGFYFSSDKSFKGTQAWRFESQQWKMRNSFYDLKESYYENSPIFHADKISTPILIWCGTDDPTIPASQSLSLYHVLRRLRKQAILLQYKSEGHLIENIENQRDLTARIKHWFDFYLKDAVPEGWLKENI